TITVVGDKLTADFTGPAPQVKGAINSPLPFTKSAVYACVRHLIGGDPPNNEGYFRPIRGCCARRHDRQPGNARPRRGARANRLSDRQCAVRGPRQDCARTRLRLRNGRRHGDKLWRLRPRAATLRLSRILVWVLGWAADKGWDRRCG